MLELMLNRLEKKSNGKNDKLEKGTWLSVSSSANKHRGVARTLRNAELLVKIIANLVGINLSMGGALGRLALSCVMCDLRNCTDWGMGTRMQELAVGLSAME